MPPSKLSLLKLLRSIEVVYLFCIVLSFYLLFLSRAGEAHTVWEVLHPVFIPVLFVTTSILLVILLSSEGVVHKLSLVIVYSVLIHSFFSIVFPAGDSSGQQSMMANTRLVYENVAIFGLFPSPSVTVQSLVYDWFRGENFQAALSVVIARMFSIDPLWIHLFLVPVLWGFFTPIAAYLITCTLTQDSKASVLASVLVSAFPYATYFGAISVPNSLGFIFFFYSLYFMLKQLSSNHSRTTTLMVVFSFFSFLSHYLTGVMAFSLLLLATAFKLHRSQEASVTARFSLAIAFVISLSLLPLSLIYLRFFRGATQVSLTLNRFYEMPFEEIVGLFLFGELAYVSDIKAIILIIVGPVIALSWMIYLLYYLKRNPDPKLRAQFHFLSAAFLIMLIDYRILKLFMERLPFSEERLWVFRDLIAVPFVALAIYAVVSSLQSFLITKSPPTITIASLKKLSKGNVLRVLSLLFALNVLIPVLLGGWITSSISVAYPHVAPLQTTWYELEAVKSIDEHTREKYVVIGDIWTIFAGERIVGIRNPRAYYFREYNKIGYDLFFNMTQNPSPQWMLLAMNYTDTRAAYFIITKPRVGTEEFNSAVSKALEIGLKVYGPPGGFGNGKLYIFYYEK